MNQEMSAQAKQRHKTVPLTIFCCTSNSVNQPCYQTTVPLGPSSYPIHIRKKQDTGNQTGMEGGLAEIDALLKEERPFSPNCAEDFKC